MWRLVPVLVAEMGQAFSELVRAEPLITEVLKLEETRFRETLERGLKPARRGHRRPRRPGLSCPARPPSASTTPSAFRSI